ncbi:stage II sporulation protein D [Haloimpatiens lingqiaonensis]|uniref:stage II sporulation protein D n=1 Tax=Haloimpatiens lingqiaonensis TaxID=1380675 RepID=UPI001FAA04D1|nr:stage II sporulation protein D [Haloimpatiens lingqiaonensis]
MKIGESIKSNVFKEVYRGIGAYFKTMASIIVIAMLSTVLLSIIFVGINHEKSVDHTEDGVRNFKNDSTSVVKYQYNGKEEKVKVYITSEDKIKEISLEDYVVGVVSGEMPANFHIEALKAQAVAARTYTISRMKKFGGGGCENGKGADLCDTVHCQVYKSKESRLSAWPAKDRDVLWKKVVQAVNETSGEVITYNGKLITSPLYFSTSSGKTENSQEVFSSSLPYLKSVSSPGEEVSNRYKASNNINYNDFLKAINSNFPKAKLSSSNVKNQVKVISRTEGGSVKTIKVGNVNVTGPQFRKALNLNSANFNISFLPEYVKIDCKGYGHGVGMSQWGANVMAKDNKKYQHILSHYYQNTEVKKLEEIMR